MPQDCVSRIRQLFKEANNRLPSLEAATAEAMRTLESIRAERAQLKDQERELERLTTHAQSSVAFLKEISGEKPAEVTTEEAEVRPTVRTTPRVEAILEAAKHLVEQGNKTIDVNDVRNELRRREIDLRVAYPTSVIGTVLARDERFRKVRTGIFEWQGHDEPRGEED